MSTQSYKCFLCSHIQALSFSTHTRITLPSLVHMYTCSCTHSLYTHQVHILLHKLHLYTCTQFLYTCLCHYTPYTRLCTLRWIQTLTFFNTQILHSNLLIHKQTILFYNTSSLCTDEWAHTDLHHHGRQSWRTPPCEHQCQYLPAPAPGHTVITPQYISTTINTLSTVH